MPRTKPIGDHTARPPVTGKEAKDQLLAELDELTVGFQVKASIVDLVVNGPVSCKTQRFYTEKAFLCLAGSWRTMLEKVEGNASICGLLEFKIGNAKFEILNTPVGLLTFRHRVRKLAAKHFIH